MRSLLRLFVRVVFLFLPLLRGNKLKRLLLNTCGHHIEKGCVLSSSLKILGNFNLKIGENTFIGHETMIIGGNSTIVIGKNCDISSRVNLVMGTHDIDVTGPRTAGKGRSENITIEDGVWIGFGVTVLPGVTIGEKSIIGAGSVVTKSIPAYSIAVGNPCRVIKTLGS